MQGYETRKFELINGIGYTAKMDHSNHRYAKAFFWSLKSSLVGEKYKKIYKSGSFLCELTLFLTSVLLEKKKKQKKQTWKAKNKSTCFICTQSLALSSAKTIVSPWKRFF